ncbi:hypothetical protein HNQ88_000475 [Aureibacter tunicatorum]|uniref:Uncharacterized protein n=1 Tax=Aureibacter tunicatorum TaxID=866807 RepID=A0AAE3XM65_9BACT|nr:hypothetical protein [Aureibacter tunicatorum]BDD02533.1 hypothetical protein AUTU_00160 [Aureibacter tunicatorum]
MNKVFFFNTILVLGLFSVLIPRSNFFILHELTTITFVSILLNSFQG